MVELTAQAIVNYARENGLAIEHGGCGYGKYDGYCARAVIAHSVWGQRRGDRSYNDYQMSWLNQDGLAQAYGMDNAKPMIEIELGFELGVRRTPWEQLGYDIAELAGLEH